MKNKTTLVWGLVLVALGVILGGNAAGLFNIDIFFKGWWTLFIIVPCFVSIFTEGKKELAGNLIGLMVGVCLLLASQGVFGFDMLWKLLVPAIIVIIGLSLIFKTTLQKGVSEKIREINKEAGEKDELVAAFSGQKVAVTKEFKGKTLSAVFGGIEFDLREAKITKDVVITASAFFGGIDIIVPEGVEVETHSTSIFGGVSDKRKKKGEAKKGAPTIYVDANCAFGGVEVK